MFILWYAGWGMKLIYASTFLLMGCSTHQVQLEYQTPLSEGESNRLSFAIAVGEFSDERGDDAKRGDGGNWFGAIRGGYGNTIKTVLTEQPIRAVVGNAFRSGLEARGSLAKRDDATHLLSGSINTFACKQYVRRDCSIALDVVLTERSSARKVFEKKYETYEFDGSAWAVDAGVFGSVDKLRDLAARTLTGAVDTVLDDEALMAAAEQQAEPADETGHVGERLEQLKALFDRGLISRGEYERKQATILDDL